MAVLGILRVLMTAENEKFVKDMKAGQKAVNSFKDDVKGMITALGVGLSVGMVVKGIKDVIKSASDMNETVSKVGVIFGDSADDIETFADTAATNLGQTKKDAMDAAATFATFGKAAGLVGDDLVGFSTDLVSLSADLASFYNTSTPDAIMAIGAALRGESEPIRKYGVLLDDATLRQKALEMGIINSIKTALTPQQRSLVAYQVILAQTSDAQGDFARTSEGLANQQRILMATTEDLKAALGEGLLPVAIKVVMALNTAAIALGILINWQEKTKQAAEEGSKAILAATGSYQKYAQGMLDARFAAGLMNEAQYKVWSGWINQGKDLKKLVDLEGMLSLEEYKSAKATQAQKDLYDDMPAALKGYGMAVEKVTGQIETQEEATARLKAEQEELKGFLSELQGFIAGPLREENENYTESMEDLNGKLAETASKIVELNQKKHLTDEQKEQLGELQSDYEEISTDITNTAKAHEEATRRIMFNILTQRAAMDELTSAELTLLTNIAFQWGLVDEATMNYTLNADAALTAFANGAGFGETLDRILGIDAAIRAVPTDIGIHFNITTTGDISGPGGYFDPGTGSRYGDGTPTYQTTQPEERGGQHGLDMIVPPGYPNDTYPIRASSGEEVIITPEGEKGRGLHIENAYFNLNFGAPVANGEQLYKEFKRRLQEDLRIGRLRG